jgi:hypothetical protein
LVEETGVPRENPWPDASHWQTIVSINIACQKLRFPPPIKVTATI